jgi:hypothetical protein
MIYERTPQNSLLTFLRSSMPGLLCMVHAPSRLLTITILSSLPRLRVHGSWDPVFHLGYSSSKVPELLMTACGTTSELLRRHKRSLWQWTTSRQPGSDSCQKLLKTCLEFAHTLIVHRTGHWDTGHVPRIIGSRCQPPELLASCQVQSSYWRSVLRCRPPAFKTTASTSDNFCFFGVTWTTLAFTSVHTQLDPYPSTLL